ncbi:sugar ABC transporter ATP-binding protein [Nocardioides hwasunensis]|uniref:Sugar ABC transporter ATP-binding protein n=1 Tax=Nocardioides hwasunensis TaxID=397258 RepID=A0ABR8MHN0_9ACTN|nr:sugar ABC transporter ATP-binding protein [Nocardioides hwasunensis]MBD3915583.1 sugar ABC transporter ATP-binding protein [Nocardioides hwasunensis]
MTAPRLAVREVTKTYGGATALRDASIEVGRGEIVALVGHNGAGKSTISKIVSGYTRPDSGTLTLDGRVVELRSPQHALGEGVGLVPQQLAVVASMTVRQNLVLGLRSAPRDVGDVARRLGLEHRLDVRVADLGPAAQRLVMIGRTLLRRPRLLILDEPTAAFSAPETARLFEIVRGLAEEEISVVYISHRLEEVLQIADRVIGMSQGRVIADRTTAATSMAQLEDIIAGGADARSPEAEGDVDDFTAADAVDVTDREVLRVEGLRTAAKPGAATFHVRSGEVVGLTGLVGAGRSSLLNAIWGVGAPVLAGTVRVGEDVLVPATPRRAIRRGVVLIPEGRHRTSLVPGMTSRENAALPTSRRRRIPGTPFIDRRRERRDVHQLLTELDTVPAQAVDMPVDALSGGNAQKVVLARWLLMPSRVVLLDEPCEGVDVRARNEIHTVLRRLADQGKGVLVSSSDVEELVESADRILVMRAGEIVAELSGPAMTVERVNRACL